MAGFIYFFPGAVGVENYGKIPDRAKKHFQHLYDVRSFTQGHAEMKGAKGVMACIHPFPGSDAEEPLLRYKPEEQRWYPVHDGNDLVAWIGWETERPPGPADLLRPKALGGMPLELCDGNHWQIPILSANPMRTTLPLSYGFDPNTSKFAPKVKAAYAELLQQADKWIDLLLDSQSETLTDNDAAYFAVQLLSYSYRVDPLTCSAEVLDLFNRDLLTKFIAIALDLHTVMRQANAQKKSNPQPDTSGMEHGGKEDSQDTNQPMPTCSG